MSKREELARCTKNGLRLQGSPWTNNREVVLAAVRNDGRALLFASKELRADRDVVLAAVQQTFRAYQYVDANGGAAEDHEVMLAMLPHRGMLLELLSANERDDRGLVLAAVRNNGMALEWASERLRGDGEVALAAIGQCGRALQLAAEALQQDRAFMLAAVQCRPDALQWADASLRGDRAFMLTVVQRDGRAIQFAEAALWSDREVVLAATQAQENFLEVPQLEVFLDVPRMDVLRFAPDALRADREAVLWLMDHGLSISRAIAFAAVSLRKDRAFVRACAAAQRANLEADWRAARAALRLPLLLAFHRFRRTPTGATGAQQMLPESDEHGRAQGVQGARARGALDWLVRRAPPATRRACIKFLYGVAKPSRTRNVQAPR